MGKRILMLLMVVVLAVSVSAVPTNALFVDPFTKINDFLVEFKFTNFFDTLDYNIEPVEFEAPVVEMTWETREIVEISKLGFSPEKLTVNVGDEVTWINKREKLDAFVIGLREINGMKSPFLQPGDEFSWTFDNIGKFTYSDGIVIGVTGMVIVE